MQNLIENDVVLWYFQIGVEQTITQCKKQSSWISYIALKKNKEKLAEQKNLVSSYLYLIFDWFKTIKVGPGGGGVGYNLSFWIRNLCWFFWDRFNSIYCTA